MMDTIEKASIRCPACRLQFETEMPEIRFSNHPELCVIAVLPSRVSCPNPSCRTQFVPQIRNAQVQFQWIKVPPRRTSSGIIIPELQLKN